MYCIDSIESSSVPWMLTELVSIHSIGVWIKKRAIWFNHYLTDHFAPNNLGYILASQTVLIQLLVLVKPLNLAHIMAFIEVHTSFTSLAKGEPICHMHVPGLGCFNPYICCYCPNSSVYIQMPMHASMYVIDFYWLSWIPTQILIYCCSSYC